MFERIRVGDGAVWWRWRRPENRRRTTAATFVELLRLFYEGVGRHGGCPERGGWVVKMVQGSSTIESATYNCPWAKTGAGK